MPSRAPPAKHPEVGRTQSEFWKRHHFRVPTLRSLAASIAALLWGGEGSAMCRLCFCWRANAWLGTYMTEAPLKAKGTPRARTEQTVHQKMSFLAVGLFLPLSQSVRRRAYKSDLVSTEEVEERPFLCIINLLDRAIQSFGKPTK
jgi:hypothetical protein